ncbi:MAG: SDR family oxidoreductase [Chloroflexota bacterium]
MRKILITGGSGYLGRVLTARAVEQFEVYTTHHTQPSEIVAGTPIALDLRQRDAVFRCVEAVQPDAIIHTAAINPGGDSSQMMAVNGEGSAYIAEAAVATKARLVHVSSDVVHNGREGAPYPDDAAPTPINVYGRSKAAGEARVAAIDPQAVMVRTSLIYGLAEIDRGTDSFVEQLEAKQTLTLFDDVLRQPVWIETLATVLLKLVDLDISGLLNVVGGQVLTREAFGRRMLTFWKMDHLGIIQAGQAAAISDTIPLDLRMDISKGEQLLGMTFPGVDEVLASFGSSP